VKKANFNDEAFLKAAEDIKALVDAGAFPENLSSLSYGDGIDLFSEGKAAMCFTGQWVLGMIGETNPLVTENKIKVIRFPSVVNGKGDARDAWGGAFAAFMVSARSKYKKEAAAFGEFLCEYIARQNYIDSQDIPLCRVAEKPKETTFLRRQMQDLAGDSAALAPGWDVFLREEDRDIYWTSLFYLFSGINTPEQFFEALPGNGR
jgi:raffinose/stachyose/melibiose transport system substrate-binding protein